MGKLVALCFINNEPGKATFLYIPWHQNLLTDVNVKTMVRSTTDTINYDFSYEIHDTNKMATDVFSYTAYKIIPSGYCTGTCRTAGSTRNNDPQWCLKGTSDGKLVCGNDSNDNMSLFYFKDGFMKCSGNSSIAVPVEVYSLNGSGGSFTLGSKVSVTDYTLTLRAPLFSSTQADDPQINSTNFNTVFGLPLSSAQRCSFSAPVTVPNESFRTIEYVNVKFNNAPIWSSRQTGDIRILRNNSVIVGGVDFAASAIFYRLSLSNTQRTPTKIVIFLEDGCACATYIWNKGGSGTWTWPNLSSTSGSGRLDMNRYNFETSSGPEHWVLANSGKQAFVVNLPALTRRNTQFMFEINNNSNSSMYGLQFMFLDADGQIVDRGSDTLGSNPDRFLCYDQLMRIWGDTYRLNTNDAFGFSMIYVGDNWNGQDSGHNLLRSQGPHGGHRDTNIYYPYEYFLYDPRTYTLMTFSDTDNEGDFILYPVDGNITGGNVIRAYPLTTRPIGNAAQWVMVPRPSREINEHPKAVTFHTITNSNLVLGVEGGGHDWGWDIGNNEIIIHNGYPQKSQDGFLLCPNLTHKLRENDGWT